MLKNKILNFLNSKKGNALLLATAGAIAATFSVYFFVSLTTLSEDSKQRVAHLYNAYQMGQSIKAKIDGADINQARLGAGDEDQIEAPVNELFHNGNFIKLSEMVKKSRNNCI